MIRTGGTPVPLEEFPKPVSFSQTNRTIIAQAQPLVESFLLGRKVFRPDQELVRIGFGPLGGFGLASPYFPDCSAGWLALLRIQCVVVIPVNEFCGFL